MSDAQNEDRLIWFNGHLQTAAESKVPVMSPTAQFGLNVFEGLRGYWSETDKCLYMFRLHDHLKRLMRSCRLIGIECPYDTDEIAEAIFATLKANSYACDIAARVTIYVDGDEGTWHNSDPVGMFIAPITKLRRSLDRNDGQRACISTWERIDDRAFPPRVKAGANYINGRYAHLEARAAGYDLPILLDRSGKVSEAAGSCLMIVRDGVLVTPPNTASILESITRETLLTLATRNGIPTQERTIDRTELYISDEIFLCGSSVELTPITSLDRFEIGTGKMGPITRQLLYLYLDAASGGYEEWLVPVPKGY